MCISSNHVATDLLSEPEFVSVYLVNHLTTKIAIQSQFRSRRENFLLTTTTLVWRHENLPKLIYSILLCLIVISFLPNRVSSDLTETGNFHRNLSPPLMKMEPSNIDSSILHRSLNPLQRLKRTALHDRHQLSKQLISFVCYKLSEPCERAAFLRLHAYHDVCGTMFPLLYLLPHIADLVAVPVLKSLITSPCQRSMSDLRLQATDGLYTNFLHTSELCTSSLEALDTMIGTSTSKDVVTFRHLLSRSFCYLSDRPTNRTGDFDCQLCQQAYLSWVCSVTFPIFYPVSELPKITKFPLNDSSSWDATPDVLPHVSSNTIDVGLHIDSLSSYKLISIPACQSWCTLVETVCPYLNPDDSTSNGGEPTFLCDESHYHYSSTTDGKLSNRCEHECCYTVDDLISSPFDDDFLSESPPFVSSDLEEACFTLATRCFHRNLSLLISDSAAQSTLSPEDLRLSSQSASCFYGSYFPLLCSSLFSYILFS